MKNSTNICQHSGR